MAIALSSSPDVAYTSPRVVMVAMLSAQTMRFFQSPGCLL